MPTLAKIAIDSLVIVLATPLAYLLRFDGAVPAGAVRGMVIATVLLAAFKLAPYLWQRFHRRSWKRTTFRDMGSLAAAVAAIAATATLLLYPFGPPLGIPRSIPLLDGFVTLLGLFAIRAGTRYAYEERMGREVADDDRSRIAVVGAGEAGSLIVRELLRHPETGMIPVAFIDDDSVKRGTRVATIPVLGGVEDVARICREQRIDQVLVAMPSEGGATVRRVLHTIQSVVPDVECKIMPGMYEVLSGRVGIERIRDVDISDLLGRPPVRLDTDAINDYLRGKTVMITGAGGSIGSELVRQICRFEPKELILFGHGENSIYRLERELDRDWPDVLYHSVIAAIQNGDRLDYIFSHFQPEVVFHAAAHKHVPLMERNPEEAIFNNVIGSRNLIEMALKYEIKNFVNISTDKAVNPTSVMGASKRMVELLVQDAATRAAPDQSFVSVRFGNVLGSRGSVIPVFKSQIRAGRPVTVTHPAMVRYFMTIPEAVSLVLQASGTGRNGEVYILDMGEPVKIVDLARDLIRLSGLEPGVDIPIVFTGMRPGEKLYEELMTEHEEVEQTPHEKIHVARVERSGSDDLEQMVNALQGAALVSDHNRIRRLLQEHIDGCTVYRGSDGTSDLTDPPSSDPASSNGSTSGAPSARSLEAGEVEAVENVESVDDAESAVPNAPLR